MINNVVDIDFAAQKVSIQSKRGAILLLDFKAAFPSMSHDFIWDALRAAGIPTQFVSVIKMFYFNNRHKLKVKGKLFDSVSVESGVRQGCPLSGVIFAVCADLLLRRIQSTLGHADLLRAYADDTAIVIEDYVRSLPYLATIFQEFQTISSMELNIAKTIFIPLWRSSSPRRLRDHVREICPPWGKIKIADYGKYLGFCIGPGAEDASWKAPLAKFENEIIFWSSMRLGLFFSTLA